MCRNVMLVIALAWMLRVGIATGTCGVLVFDQTTDALGTWGAQVNPRGTVLGSSATIEAWVAFSDAHSTFGDFYNEWSLALEDKHLRLGPMRIEGFLYGASEAGDLVATPLMLPDRWYHVAYVYDGAEESIYINGTRIANRPATGNVLDYPRTGEDPAFNEGYAGLGAYRRPTLTSSFTGVIESFRISSSARYSGESSVVPQFGNFAADSTTLSLMNFEEVPTSEFVTATGPGGFTGRLGTIVPGPNGTAPQLLSSYDASLPGDFNQDGSIDAADYTVWRDTFETSTAGPADADADGDVDLRDYEIWSQFYGSQPGASATQPDEAPEPRALSVTFLALALMPSFFARRAYRQTASQMRQQLG